MTSSTISWYWHCLTAYFSWVSRVTQDLSSLMRPLTDTTTKDNSGSMDFQPERSDQLMDISANIVDVESIYENTAYVRIEFLNGPQRGDPVSTADQARKMIGDIENWGHTPLGTQMRRKVLDRFVYPELNSKGTFRPKLICVITDGDVSSGSFWAVTDPRS